jgi:hypothetical protein
MTSEYPVYRCTRFTGLPCGGWYAIATDGHAMRPPSANHGDMPPRYRTPEMAEANGLRMERAYMRLMKALAAREEKQHG